MNQVILIGAGGHARSLLDAIASGGVARACAVVEKDASRWQTELLGVPVVGGEEIVPRLRRAGANGYTVAIAGLGTATLRKTLFDRWCETGLAPFSVIHPTSHCSPYASFEQGVQVLASTVVNAEARIGHNTIINTGAIVEHDCVIGPHCHLAPRSCLAGAVSVGAQTHIGLGAVVKEGVSIGSNAVIGAGAVVLDDVPDNSVYVGIPARPLRRSAA